MRISVLEYYIKAIDYGSINRAARELFIAQSSLSEALSTLEKDLGCTLIKRSNKGIVPTKIGEEIYKDAQKIIQIMKKWESFSSVEPEYNGDYHILATYAMCNCLLKEMVIEVKKIYPKLNLILHETRAERLLSDFEKGSYHIAFCFFLPYEEKKTDDFIRRHRWKKQLLYNDYFHIALSSKNKLAQKKYLEKKDLKNLALAQYAESDYVSRKYYQKYFNNQTIFLLNNKDNMLQIVAEDKAATMGSGLLMKNNFYYKINLINVLPIKDKMLPLTYYAVYRPHRLYDKVAELLINEVKKEIDKLRSRDNKKTIQYTN